MIIITILGTFLKLVFILLLVLIVMLFLILLIPFDYRISALLKEKPSFSFHIHWVLFQVEILLEDMKFFVKVRIFRRIIVNESLKKSLQKKTVKKATKSNFKMPGMAFFKEFLKFSKEVLNMLKPKEMTAFGYYGMNDPAHTAMVSAIIQLFSKLAPWAQIGLEPVFESEMTDVEINIYGRIRLIVFVWILIKYLFKREVRQVVFQKRINTET